MSEKKNPIRLSKRANLMQALIVEDDPVEARSLAKSFSRVGFVAHTVASVAEAVEWIGHQTDVILIDLRLNDESGLAVMDAFKDKSPETFMVVYSHIAEDPIHGTLAGERKPDLILRKIDREKDVLTICTAVQANRLRIAEAEIKALTFIIGGSALAVTVWFAVLVGYFCLPADWTGHFLWLSSFHFVTLWTVLLFATALHLMERASRRYTFVSASSTFASFVKAKTVFFGLLSALLLKVVVSLYMAI